jgi:hypothetical protein
MFVMVTGGERDLLVRFHATRDPALRERIVTRHLPMARRIARVYARRQRRVAYEDLEQIASIGLIKAVDRFDPSSGSAFVVPRGRYGVDDVPLQRSGLLAQKAVHVGAAGSPSQYRIRALASAAHAGLLSPLMIMLIVGASRRSLANSLARADPRRSAP